MLIGIHKSSIQQWIRNYQSMGINGLENITANSNYSKALKETAVKDYLAGIGSMSVVCKKYGIKSQSSLIEWINGYNNHMKLKSSKEEGVPIMTTGRNTTFDERVEIVKYCIEHQNNYAETSQAFQVSYQQVYTWVSKYEKKVLMH